MTDTPSIFVSNETGSLTTTDTIGLQIQAMTSATKAGVEYRFVKDLSSNDALLNQIKWVDVSQDNITDFTVSIDGSGAWISAFETFLTTAVGGKLTNVSNYTTNRTDNTLLGGALTGTTGNFETVLESEFNTDLESMLASDSIAAYLQSQYSRDISMNMGYAAGALDMYTKLSNTQHAALKHLIAQIPDRTSPTETQESGSLSDLVINGDKIVFVYNVTTNVTVTTTIMNSNTDPVGNIADPAGVYGSGKNPSSNIDSSRMVAFVWNVQK